MILTIAIMVILTIAIAAFVLAPRMFEQRIVYEQVPDRPASFGYKMAWLAIRSRNTDAVLDALNLTSAVRCNWKSGIGTVYDHHLGNDHIFVSPPVNGWTFVVGLALPHPAGRGFADKARLEEAGHAVRRRALEREQVLSGMRVEVREARAALEAARARVTVAERIVAQAEEGQRIVRDRYEQGLADGTALTRAAEQVLQASRQQVRARVDVQLASANLERVLGR